MSAEAFPAGPTPAGELASIAEQFPMRDGRGNVTGFYVYRRGTNSGREAGPFATIEEAEEARDASTSLAVLDIVCGHVFTSRGTIVRAHDGGMAGVRVGDVVSYEMGGAGLSVRALVLTAGSRVSLAGLTFEAGRMALVKRDMPAAEVTLSARAGEPEAARFARDVMAAPHATVADEVRAAWVANGEPR